MAGTCRRCGECCRRGGPVLHLEDRILLEKRILSVVDLVRIRRGEPVVDPVRGRLERSNSAMLKIGGRGNDWCCRFFVPSPPACGIHGQSPLECRLLFCRAPEALEKVMGRDLLPLSGVPGIDPEMIEAAEGFDHKFPFAGFNRLVEPVLAGSVGIFDLEALVNEEAVFRIDLCRRQNLGFNLEPALLGRPFFITAAALGIGVSETSTGLVLRLPR